MFTGIIETVGEVVRIVDSGEIRNIVVQSTISTELRPEQSVAHDGVCLTIVSVLENTHTVQLVQETLQRSHFKHILVGASVNLEQAMPANGRFEGHIVQGHVDGVGEFEKTKDGIYTFRYPQAYSDLLVEKGSICINGVSLTVTSVQSDVFGVALIPYTLSHTNLHLLKPGMEVNLEFDILAKHLKSMLGDTRSRTK